MTIIEITLVFALVAVVAVAYISVRTSRDFKKRIAELTEENKNALIEVSKSELKASSADCLINNISFPVWIRNKDLSIVYCNAAYSDILEEANEEVVQLSIRELHRDIKSIAIKAVQKKEPQIYRKHLIVSGERRLFRITESPINNVETIGFAHDIKELEDKEKSLKYHMSVQSDLLESSASAIAIYGANKRLKFFNNAFVNLWKLDERWLETKPPYGEILEVLREKGKLPEQANFRAFKKDSIALFNNLIKKHEEFYYLTDGIILRVIVIPHEHGGLLFSYEDMTEKIALERSYNTLLSVRKSTLDNLYEGVAVFGEDGRLQLSNPVFADIWNLEESFLKSEPHISQILDKVRHFYDPSNDSEWQKKKQSIVSLIGYRKHIKQTFEIANGVILERSCVPLPDGATLMMYKDITDSTKLEESLRAEKIALEEADNLKTDFLSNMSYELRSPLTTIKGFSEVLLQEYFGKMNSKQEEYIRGIFDSSINLASLIDDILDIASIDAGYMTLEVKEFDIHSILVQSISKIEKTIEENNIDFIFDYQYDIGSMYGDEKRIKQVITHLLANAIAFCDLGGKVTLKVFENDKGEIVFLVEDDGKGISQEDLQNVFKRFHRSTSDSYSGIGLGLPVAKSFIEMHGGSIELESEEDIGTKITCHLKRRK